MSKKFLPLYISEKIIKLDRDFPKLWSQMYCHLFMVHSVVFGNIWFMTIFKEIAENERHRFAKGDNYCKITCKQCEIGFKFVLFTKISHLWAFDWYQN